MQDEEPRSYSKSMNNYSEVLSVCTLPLFYKDGDEYKHAGTGILVKAVKSDFLISASHVFDPYFEGKQLFFIIGNKKVRPLTGRLRRLGDPYDIGVLKLSDESRPPYPAVEKKSLLISSIVPGLVPRQNKQYMVNGFPASRTKLDWRSQLAISELRPFLTGSFPVEMYDENQLKQENFLLLDFKKKDFFTLEGQNISYPDPQGLSGSPVWMTLDRANANDPLKTPLVGVITDYDPKEKYIKACDIGCALALIILLELNS